MQQFRSKLELTVYPIQWIVDTPNNLIKNLLANFSNKNSLLQENERLKQELFSSRSDLLILDSLKRENYQLKNLNLSMENIKAKGIVGRVIRVDTDPFSRMMLLNKGKPAGAYIGQPVIDANGVMGNIVSVNDISSSLMLITDPSNAIPVVNLRNDIRGIAVGIGKNDTLLLQHMSITADIQVGDKFVTSGLGGRYPKGYPVGIVKNVYKNPSNKFLEVSLEPIAKLDISNIVLLIDGSKPQ